MFPFPLGPLGSLMIPDSMGSCAFLPTVNSQLKTLNDRKQKLGEEFPGSSYHSPDRKNWMSQLEPSSIPLQMIAWPGTHNSATSSIGNLFTESYAECQNITIYGQLQMGVRVLDIRIREDCKICHGPISSSQGIDVVIDQVKRFLAETVSEIVILEIRTEFGYSDPPNFEDYLVEKLGDLLIYQDDEVFKKTILELLPRRIICVWKPRNSAQACESGFVWNDWYLRDDWIDTDLPLTKFEGNLTHLKEQTPVWERRFFYRIESTVTAQTDNPLEFLLPWTKQIDVLNRRICGFARLFLAQCHAEAFLDRLQIFSADFIDEDFVDACIGLTYARATN
ncbi:Phosphatidylinositol-specific phospholipase C, X domain [Dillenia turbinata]|uniref:Phosphatidylinositol-specific phospholipase C, X domain n=1 Tax=Dillenia turbinata TaxID=194707 RepID=A0AAN8VCU4_9MAGN